MGSICSCHIYLIMPRCIRCEGESPPSHMVVGRSPVNQMMCGGPSVRSSTLAGLWTCGDGFALPYSNYMAHKVFYFYKKYFFF